MALLDIIANFALIITIAQFLSGIQMCIKIYKKGSTVDLSAFPFVAGVMCNTLWLRYGLYLQDNTMILVNVIGITLQSIYLVWFYFYTFNRRSINKQLVFLLSFLSLVFYLLPQVSNPHSMIGTLACLSSLVFCGAPLVMVADVIKTRSTESLPFLLILSSFFCGLSWFLYGLILSDAFILVPNGIGSLISGVQLSLFAIYPSSKSKLNKD